MSLTTILLAAFFILYAVSTLGWIPISATVLGVIALIVGILILVDAYHPILPRRA
jgi:hypothetical protein